MTRIISQAVDELGNFYLLKDDGILEKRDPLNVPLWSQQTKQEPTIGTFVFANSISLDLDNNVWLTFSDSLNITVRLGATGLQTAEVLGSAANVIVAQAGGDKMFALSTSRGILYEVKRSTRVLIRDFDLSVKIPNYNDGMFTTQIAASDTGKIWFGALVGPVGEAKVSVLVGFDPSGSGSFACYPMTGVDVAVTAVGSDCADFIYAATLHGSVFRLDETTQTFDAMYDPPAPGGVINIVTFTNSAEPVLIDDGTFAFLGSKTRIVNPANGAILSTTTSTNVGTTQGDPLGYHHIKCTRINVPPSPIVPVVDVSKFDVFVKLNGVITFTGRPGAVTDTLSVKCIRNAVPLTPVGTVVPNSDGSFSVTSGLGVGIVTGEACTIEAINGLEVTTLAITSEPRNVPATFEVDFQASGFIVSGVPYRLKAKITDGVGGPFVVPAPGISPMFRLKRDSDSKWFNTGIFVPDNGDYIQPSYDVDADFWFADVTLPDVSSPITLTFIIKDSPPFTTSLILIPEIADKETLDEVKAAVDELNAKVDIAFGAPAASFTDPTTIGGFMFERLVDIQKHVRRINASIIGTRNVVVESIVVDVSRQAVARGSTPSIDITVYDEERRFPLDISGGQVFFKAKVNLASPVLVIDRLSEIIDGLTGQARAKLTTTDTATAQRLSGQIVVILPGVGTLVSPPFVFDVNESVL
jgi:hypothetical protein